MFLVLFLVIAIYKYLDANQENVIQGIEEYNNMLLSISGESLYRSYRQSRAIYENDFDEEGLLGEDFYECLKWISPQIYSVPAGLSHIYIEIFAKKKNYYLDLQYKHDMETVYGALMFKDENYRAFDTVSFFELNCSKKQWHSFNKSIP